MAVHFNDNNNDDLTEAHEINVTPFIDVMLVLLIIFMVAAPLATVHIKVDLPAASAQAQPKPDKPVFLTIKKDLTLALNDTIVLHSNLMSSIRQVTGGNEETRIFLRADKSVNYGELMEIISQLSTGGYLKVALVGLEDTSAVNEHNDY